MVNGQYAVIAGEDATFPLAPSTLGTLRRLREIDVRSACIDTERKEYICSVMRWDRKVISEEIDEIAYFEGLAVILFPLAPVKKNPDKIDFKEVLRAKEDFLS